MPAQQGLERDVQGTFGPKWRYREQIIVAGAPIFALGAVERIDKTLLEPEEDDGRRRGRRQRGLGIGRGGRRRPATEAETDP
jgi:hypothetical protein